MYRVPSEILEGVSRVFQEDLISFNLNRKSEPTARMNPNLMAIYFLLLQADHFYYVS